MMFKAWFAVLLVWAIGAAVFTLSCSDPRRWVLAAKLGLSFGVGLATLTLTLFLASLCGVKPSPWLGLSELIALWAIVFAAKRKQLFEWLTQSDRVHHVAEPFWIRMVEVALVIFVIGIVSVVAAVTILEPIVEWDVMGIWALKAKVLLHEPVLASGYFRDLSKAYSHLDYPLLWPMAMAWIWSWNGESDLASVKVLGIALLASFLMSFFGLLRRRQPRVVALLLPRWLGDWQ